MAVMRAAAVADQSCMSAKSMPGPAAVLASLVLVSTAARATFGAAGRAPRRISWGEPMRSFGATPSVSGFDRCHFVTSSCAFCSGAGESSSSSRAGTMR